MKSLISATALFLTLVSALSAPQASATSSNTLIASSSSYLAQVPQTQSPSSGQDNSMPSRKTIPPSQNMPSSGNPSRENSSDLRIEDYPAYCSSLPPGVVKGDWYYREALDKCKYGN